MASIASLARPPCDEGSILAGPCATRATTSVLLGNGNGTFQAAVNYPMGINADSVAVGDFEVAADQSAKGRVSRIAIAYPPPSAYRMGRRTESL